MRPSRAGTVVVGGGAVLAALLLGACQFSYDNPAERLGVGEVTGRTVADVGVEGAMEPAAGVSISIKGSAFDQVTHDSGRFFMIPLPAGSHTLLFRKGTEYAFTRVVSVELGPDGQPDGVDLGDVQVPFAASAGGQVDGAIATTGGDVVDEPTGLTATVFPGGRFRLDGLSLGEHVLKVGMVNPGANLEWLGGPRRIRIDPPAQSSVVPLADIPVRPATTALGHLRFRLLSLHGSVAAPDVLVTVTERLRGPLAAADIPAPTSRGWIELDVREGIYEVRIAAPPPYDTEVSIPAPTTAIVMADEVADLGSLYLVPPGIPAAAQRLCRVNDDCGKAGPCAPPPTAGPALPAVCPNGWNPQPSAPAGVPVCTPQIDVCAPGLACTTPGAAPGTCSAAGGRYAVCVPCGQDCTLDGVLTYHGGC